MINGEYSEIIVRILNFFRFFGKFFRNDCSGFGKVPEMNDRRRKMNTRFVRSAKRAGQSGRRGSCGGEFNAVGVRGLPRGSEAGQKRTRMPPLIEKRVMPAVAFTSVVRISWFG